MIIFDNKDWITSSVYPDSKFNEDAQYWVEDDSEIADFIRNSNRHFKVTSSDETGKILVVEEYYPIEELKENKKQEINQACSSAIYSGYDYNNEHYDLSDEDQINMLAWSSVAQQGNSVPYHSSGNPCRTYTSEEFLGLVTAVTTFKTYNLTYCNLLKLQIDEMVDREEIASVKYGATPLNGKYQSILNSIIGGETYERENAEESDTI